jgi:hypothetical protein
MDHAVMQHGAKAHVPKPDRKTVKMVGVREFKLCLLMADPDEYGAFLLLRKAFGAEHMSEEHFAQLAFGRGLEVMAAEIAEKEASERLVKLPHEVQPR